MSTKYTVIRNRRTGPVSLGRSGPGQPVVVVRTGLNVIPSELLADRLLSPNVQRRFGLWLSLEQDRPASLALASLARGEQLQARDLPIVIEGTADADLDLMAKGAANTQDAATILMTWVEQVEASTRLDVAKAKLLRTLRGEIEKRILTTPRKMGDGWNGIVASWDRRIPWAPALPLPVRDADGGAL
ncbi:MAG: hypothetical protein HYY06_01520 [Deltaproteobacteria bacterium]|nr:hypothetical protein [Deltaproteobacteria bacterium]